MASGIPFLDKIPTSDIGLKIRSLLPARRHSDIFNRIDISLLLFDNTLVNTANGESEEISLTEDGSFPEAMARAARRLARGDKHNILLLLPTADFVATAYHMNLASEKMIRSALELQAQSLIPAYEENLLLAVNAAQQEGVALWFNEQEANRLFRAFAHEDLFLGAIMPRSLAVLGAADDDDLKTMLINDEEGSNISFLQVRTNAVRRLLTVNRRDLEQEVFARQWEIETSQLKGDAVRNMTSMDDWKALKRKVQPLPEYSFLPAGAIAEQKRISFARNSKVAMAATAVVVLLLLAPFISRWLELSGVLDDLETAQVMSAEPRALQASIFDMEEEWGALYEYPDQEVAQVLVSLNSVIQSSLTSISINKGVVDITGSTNDPAYLVELLSEREEFNNVSQSTSTRGAGSQFGIRLNLTNVDFEDYEEKYPARTQGR
jgi:hypothetical protein